MPHWTGFKVAGSISSGLQMQLQIQSTLDFATMVLAANLDLASTRGLTDFCQYINSDLGGSPYGNKGGRKDERRESD